MNQTPTELQAPYLAALVAAARDYLRATGTGGSVIEIPASVPPSVIVLGHQDHVCALLREPTAEQFPGGAAPAILSWEDPTPGAPRKWTILMPSEGHGLVGALGAKFDHAPEKYERIDVVELVLFVDQLVGAAAGR